MFVRETFAVGPLRCNCTIIGDTAAGEAIVIDPGDEVPRIRGHLARLGLTRVRAIVHTHAHIDHIGGAAELHEACAAPVHLHPDDGPLHQMLPLQAQLLGLPPARSGAIDVALADGDVLTCGSVELAVLHTPGHTPGSVSFAVTGHELCFTGDTLFAGGVGRTDLPGGDAAALARSIRGRLYTLHGDTAVVPGHGGETRIDRERRSNPWVRGAG